MCLTFVRFSAETSFRDEVDKLNAEIGKLVTLNKMKEANCNGLENKISSAAKSHEEREEALRKQLLSEEEIKAIKERNVFLEKRIAGLETELTLERKAKDVVSKKLEQQKGELELAWAEMDGRQTSLPRGKRISVHDAGEIDAPRLIEKQLRNEYESREKALLEKVANLETALTEQRSNNSRHSNTLLKHAAINTTSGGPGEDEFTDRLIAYHEQLERATEELNKAHEDNIRRRYQLVAKDAANFALQKVTSIMSHPPKGAPSSTFKSGSSQTDTQHLSQETVVQLKVQIKTLLTKIEQMNAEVSGLKRDKALFAADLAVSRNEVSRLQAENGRQKATTRSGHCPGCARSRKLLEISKKELDGLRQEVRKLQLS